MWGDEGWRAAGCVDFWVYYRHAGGSLDTHLDWWSLERLGEFVSSSHIVCIIHPTEHAQGEAVWRLLLRLLTPDGDIKVGELAYVVVVGHDHVEFRTHFGHFDVEAGNIDSHLKG